MDMPFTAEQFFEVFAQYNVAVWPMQFAALQLGVLEDVMLLITSLLASALLLYRDRTLGQFKPSWSH